MGPYIPICYHPELAPLCSTCPVPVCFMRTEPALRLYSAATTDTSNSTPETLGKPNLLQNLLMRIGVILGKGTQVNAFLSQGHHNVGEDITPKL